MRDPVKIQKEMGARRQLVLSTAFQTFQETPIEMVKMNDIAKEAGIGVATLYRYFPTKLSLVLAVSVSHWQIIAEKVEAYRPTDSIPQFSARQRMEYFMDMIIWLYREERALLRFHSHFDAYVRHEACTVEELAPYYEALSIVPNRFHWMYEQAKIDGTIRTDLPEEDLFNSTVNTMLFTAAKYACGATWPKDIGDSDAERCLLNMKEMILNFSTANL